MLANPADEVVRALLNQPLTIAMVGASANQARPAHGVMRYLLAAGYEVVPVNPGLAGGTLLGRPVYAKLAEIPDRIDLVDIFRRREALSGIVEEALRLEPLPKAIWMQLGLRDDDAAGLAISAGIIVVMDRCVKVDHARLL